MTASPSPKHEVSCKMAATHLKCSVGTVYSFIAQGLIRRRQENPEGHGRVWLDADDVLRVARTWKRKRRRPIRKHPRAIAQEASEQRARIAKVAFPMFRARRTLDDIVVATEADPVLIQHLYETWLLGVDGVVREKAREKKERAAVRDERAFNQQRRYEQHLETKVRIARVGGGAGEKR